MAFDSTVMAVVAAELARELTGGRISKIYQPQADELVLLIYAGGVNHRLLLSANARFARIQLTRTEKRNPPAPPTFCMLLRKYVEGGRIMAIRQAGRERICRIQIGVTDELGNPAEFTLVAEVMGKHSNIILLNPQGRIVDAVRRVTEEVNRYRELLPGLPYLPPPPVNKLDPLTVTAGVLAALQQPEAGKPAWQFLLDAVDGLGPLLAREAVARAGYGAEAPLGSTDLEPLARSVRDLAAPASYEPVLLYDTTGRLKEFHALPQVHWAGRTETGFASVSACLDAFYGRREEDDRIGALRGSLSKVVRDEAARVRKKLHLQLESQTNAENAEELRVLGELITANLWQIKKGDAEATVVNYYDPDERTVTVALDLALEPAQNAQAYYRRYQKARSGRAAIAEQVARSQAELEYLAQVEAMLEAASSLPDLEEVRRELQEEGYLSDKKKGRGEPKGRGDKQKGRGDKPQKAPKEDRPSPPLTIRSSDGLEIWVGKNNRQNDYLTLKLAAPHDIWLHTKEIPGSHVILRVPPGQSVPERALHEAAALAAFHSRGRDSASVPVDYTLRKHVRKPSGARPGMVIYEHQKTLWVTPDPALNPILVRLLGGDAGGTGEAHGPNGSSDSGTP
ncbi:MAG TPA: NFACT RNA binding domain-containing protein [Symbiobacteriaceae bacterium]|jgi:predicted ribosome quality control (RQC) complex YloA/Tae2 family protein